MSTGSSDYSVNLGPSLNYMGGVATSAYNVSIDSIKIALAVTVALAWYNLVKKGIDIIWPSREDKFFVFGLYTVVITILFAIIIAFVNDFLSPRKLYSPSIPMMYAVTPRRSAVMSDMNGMMMPPEPTPVEAPSNGSTK